MNTSFDKEREYNLKKIKTYSTIILASLTIVSSIVFKIIDSQKLSDAILANQLVSLINIASNLKNEDSEIITRILKEINTTPKPNPEAQIFPINSKVELVILNYEKQVNVIFSVYHNQLHVKLLVV